MKRFTQFISEATPAWQRSEGKNPEGGLNRKGVASSKKPTKYHYYFTYDRKNFSEIRNGLKKRYPKMFYDSESFLTNNPFAVHFYCTPEEYKRIVAFARSRYGKIKSVSRYTHDEYLGYR